MGKQDFVLSVELLFIFMHLEDAFIQNDLL